MKKYLKIVIEAGPPEAVTEFEPLRGDESVEAMEQQAADVFSNYCSYGFVVVDESEVPEDER